MFLASLLLLSTHLVPSLAAPPLLQTINPASLTSSVNLNSTALKEADVSAQALTLTSSHISALSSPRHVNPPSKSPSIPTSLPLTIHSRNTTTATNIDDIVYHVPDTRTTIHIRFRQDRPLEKRGLGGFLLLMVDQVEAHITAAGDGWLLPQDDPFVRDWPGSGLFLRLAALSPMFFLFFCVWANGVCAKKKKGFYFIAKSSPLPIGEGEGRLSYGVMVNVLRGETLSSISLTHALSIKSFNSSLLA